MHFDDLYIEYQVAVSVSTSVGFSQTDLDIFETSVIFVTVEFVYLVRHYAMGCGEYMVFGDEHPATIQVFFSAISYWNLLQFY